MATTLTGANAGTVSYGSFTFDPVTTETISVQLRPMQDHAKRTIIYVEETFTIRTVLYSTQPATVDNRIRAACRTLTSQGDKFIYKNKGFGTDYDININGRKDVIWGPVPKIVSLKPMADKYAWELIWTVTVAIPECNAAKYENAIMEWNYMVDYSKDRYGYTTRTVSGYLAIPQTRTTQNDRKLKKSADEYREQIRPATPEGFRPGTDRVILSEDKCRLQFSFIDVQMPSKNALPTGVIDATMSMSWENISQRNLLTYSLRFDAEFTLAMDVPLSQAQIWFWGIVYQRLWIIGEQSDKANMAVKDAKEAKAIEDARKDKALWEQAFEFAGDVWRAGIPALPIAKYAIEGMDAKKIAKDKFNKLPVLIPLSWSASEPDIFGPPKARLSVTFQSTFTKASFMTFGLWYPLEGTKWDAWKKSVGQVFNVRGEAGLMFNVNDDVIIDLCREGYKKDSVLKGKRPAGQLMDTPPIFGNLTREKSWLEYTNAIRIEEQSSIVAHKPIPTDSKLKAKLKKEDGVSVWKTPALTERGLNPFGDKTHPQTPSTSQFKSDIPTIVQMRTDPTYYVILIGRAVRAGWEVVAPELIQIGDSIAVPANDPDLGDGITQAVIGNCGVPIFGATWQLRYVMTKKPEGVASPPDPIIRPVQPVQDYKPRGDLDWFAPDWETPNKSGGGRMSSS